MTFPPPSTTFSGHANAVIKLIEDELSKEPTDRETNFENDYLRGWLKTTQKMKEDFETSNLPPRNMRDQGLHFIIAESWAPPNTKSHNTKLGEAITELERRYINL